jgi:LysM repeat protein
VRFVSPRARSLAAQLYDRLVREGRIKGQYASLHHRVRRGDTLGALARRYRISVAALQQQNGLRSTRIRVGQRLLVRQPVALKGVKGPVVVPRRRRPVGE